MSTPRLIELAKDGNPKAIARLINQQLETRGVKAIASREGSCLRLLLESPKAPKKSVVVPYLQQALTKLSSASFDQVEVYGRKQGDVSGWQTALVLKDQRFAVESSGDTAVVGQSPRLNPERTLRSNLTLGRDAGQTSAATRPSAVTRRPEARHHRQQDVSGKDVSGQDVAMLNAQLLSPLVPGATLERPSRTRVARDRQLNPQKKSHKNPRKNPFDRFKLGRFKPDRFKSDRFKPNSSYPSPSNQPLSQATTPPATGEHRHDSSEVAQQPGGSPTQRFPLLHLVSIWFQWQGAAWQATVLAGLIALVTFGLVFFGIFSLANRLSETGVLILSLIAFGVMVPILGLLLGDAQTRILHRWSRRTGGWRWLTMLGFMVGVAIAWGTHFLLSNMLGPFILNPTQGFVIGQGIAFASTTVGLIFGLMCLSTIQWLVIRSFVPRAYEWVLVNVFGGLLSWCIGMAISARWIAPLVESNSSYDFWSQLTVIGAGGLLSWLVFHAVSGMGMARLLQRLPLRTP